MTNIVLCGGEGKRLWPISQEKHPKQFIKIFHNQQSLFQQNIIRNATTCAKHLIVCNENYNSIVFKQLDELKIKNTDFIFEPVGRNTAASLALSCLSLPEDEIVIVTPSDHLIEKLEEYYKSVSKAIKYANNGYIVTFGIKPTQPETSYGYIKSIENDVQSFHEKPEINVAQKYYEDKNYYWNSGILCFRVKDFLDQLRLYASEVYDNALIAYQKSDGCNINYNDMVNIPNCSIDHALLENVKSLKMIPSTFDWSDLGSFHTIHNYLYNNIISNQYKQEKKQWGNYIVLDNGTDYKIKYLSINPQSSLSLQKHFHRSEYWTVMSGIATVITENKQIQLKEHQSTYINVGEKHQLINNTSKELIIIEIQVGDYTEEDDIIRYDICELSKKENVI